LADGGGKVLVLRRWLRIALAAFALTVMTLPLATAVIFVSLFTSSPRPSYIICRIWAWGVSKITGVRYSLQGAENALPGTSYVITPNHQSNADILALMRALPTPYRWVIKKELTKIPLFGLGLLRTGAVSLDRSDPKKSLEKLQSDSGKLKGGWSLLIYPEGTRSRDGNLQQFKKGAFVLAVSTGIPILPVTVNGAHKVLPKHSLEIRPGVISVTIGQPIPTVGLGENDIPSLMEKTRQAVAKHFDLNYDPFHADLPK
jgi:1-acyl-sn-glycerol-3-phosphate acyltransferase